jgi:hypothetical protein
MSHDRRCNGEEVPPILPALIGARKESDERFLHQRGRLDGVVSPFAPELATSETMQIGSNQRYESVQSFPVAAPPAGE